jgi:hypothetical protein
MKNLLKSWLPATSGTKKFLAAALSHKISKVLNRKKFEVVFEGFIDLHNFDSEQPDIVVYNKEENMNSVMIIEFCSKENLEPAFTTIEILSKIYHIRESFIYDIDKTTWHLLKNGSEKFEVNNFSEYFNMNMDQLLAEEISSFLISEKSH